MILSLKQNINNIPGWKTRRRIVVFESDDWGSVRMPSKNVYNELLKGGIKVNLCPYNKYDTLASRIDLEHLFNLLIQFKDKNGKNPIITGNVNVANPHFEKIKERNFEKYYFEPFTDTLKKYYPNDDVFEIWQESIKDKLFYPQLHGREHVNPIIWMNLLKNNHLAIKKAFDLEAYGLSMITSNSIVLPHLASLIYRNKNEKGIIEKSIIEGANLFENIFNFKSESFIAPLFTWSFELEDVLKEVGVKYIQGGNSHKNYDVTKGKFVKLGRHFMGDRNKNGQIYLIRNSFFEPSLTNNYKIEDTLDNIERAFRWNKPAIISVHRLNFIGELSIKNRDNNLSHFNSLLKQMLKKWPNIEFLTSTELGSIISN